MEKDSHISFFESSVNTGSGKNKQQKESGNFALDSNLDKADYPQPSKNNPDRLEEAKNTLTHPMDPANSQIKQAFPLPEGGAAQLPLYSHSIHNTSHGNFQNIGMTATNVQPMVIQPQPIYYVTEPPVYTANHFVQQHQPAGGGYVSLNNQFFAPAGYTPEFQSGPYLPLVINPSTQVAPIFNQLPQSYIPIGMAPFNAAYSVPVQGYTYPQVDPNTIARVQRTADMRIAPMQNVSTNFNTIHNNIFNNYGSQQQLNWQTPNNYSLSSVGNQAQLNQNDSQLISGHHQPIYQVNQGFSDDQYQSQKVDSLPSDLAMYRYSQGSHVPNQKQSTSNEVNTSTNLSTQGELTGSKLNQTQQEIPQDQTEKKRNSNDDLDSVSGFIQSYRKEY